MNNLEGYPCGAKPTPLNLTEGKTCKYGLVCGDCCGEWLVEFRADHCEIDSEECVALAKEAWNQAARMEETK